MKNILHPKWLARLIPTAMILFIAGISLYGANRLLNNPPAPGGLKISVGSGAATQPETEALEKQLQELKNEADGLKTKEDDLKWILGLIITVAGLFTIAQGVAAWFNAQSFTQQAEKMLAEAKARFSVFSMLQERRDDAYTKLTNLEQALALSSPVNSPDEGFDWRRRFYEKIPLKLRRELLSAEQIFPYEVIGQNEPADVFARNLRRMAQFYWSKFIYERDWGTGHLADLEHAQYLLDLAMRKIGSVFFLLNDTGNIQIELYKFYSSTRPATPTAADLAESERLLGCARRSFEDSIQAQRHQLRAHYNLAFIEAELSTSGAEEQRLKKAIAFLNDGLQYANWERSPVIEHTCEAYYNRACYYAKLSQWDRSGDAECIAALREASEVGMVPPLDVEHDFNASDGDFYGFFQNATAETQGLLMALKRKLSLNYRID